MTWKGQIWKRRIASVSIRQESLRRSSVTEQRREYSPEGNRVIPRERYVSYFVLKTSKIWKESEEFYSYRVWIIYTGSEVISKLLTPQKLSVHAEYKLFTPH